jgi:hypothetical protein
MRRELYSCTMYDAGKGIRTRDYYDDMVAPERDTDHQVAVQDGTFELVKGAIGPRASGNAACRDRGHRVSSARLTQRQAGGAIDSVDDGHVLDRAFRRRFHRFAT